MRDFEFEGGRLTKYKGARPEYMSGTRLIEVVRELAEQLDTRPAAPVEGLETLKLNLLQAVQHFDDFPPSIQNMANIRVVEAAHKYVEQAEAIIAAKDALHSSAVTTMIEMHQDLNELETDNAALTARVKELDHENNCWMKSAIKQQKLAKALETKLAAAEKALEPFADHANDRSVDDTGWRDKETVKIVVSIGDLRKARAVIGGNNHE